ncbi:hypothetical protein CCACVL1_03769, partial [Corchorus capsularis]
GLWLRLSERRGPMNQSARAFCSSPKAALHYHFNWPRRSTANAPGIQLRLQWVTVLSPNGGPLWFSGIRGWLSKVKRDSHGASDGCS